MADPAPPSPGSDGGDRKDRDSLGGSIDRGTQAIAVALTFAVAVALFGYGGYWLDGLWGTSPWFLLVGVVFGTVGGFLHVVLKLAPDLLPWGASGDGPKDS